MIDWIHAGPSVTAAFLGSLVECVEAVTIVLAVGTVRGWRGALLGAAGGLAVLTALVVGLGPALAVIPLTVLQLVVGLLLLLFGLSWLRKAVLRAAGIIPLHDERRAFEARPRRWPAPPKRQRPGGIPSRSSPRSRPWSSRASKSSSSSSRLEPSAT